VGRLEDIIARNRNLKGNRERVMVTIAFGVALLVILALMVFTDLGKPPPPPRPSDPTPSKDHHVDDVLLRAPRAR
jgi:hypothetical protein